MQEKEETVHQALYSGTEKRKGTPLPLIINKMTRRTWLQQHMFTLELVVRFAIAFPHASLVLKISLSNQKVFAINT